MGDRWIKRHKGRENEMEKGRIRKREREREMEKGRKRKRERERERDGER